MNLFERMKTENVDALRAGDTKRRAALSFIVANLTAKAKASKVETLTDADSIAALQKERKSRQDTLAEIEKGGGGREEAVAQAKYEISVIEEFLPAEPSEEEINAAVASAISSTGASSMKDMGKVMSAVSANLSGVDKSKLSQVIKAALTPK